MKSLLPFFLTVVMTANGFAQWAVHDGVSHSLLLKGNADYLQQMATTFQKMDQEIRTLQDTLRQTEQIVETMGDPAKALQQIGGLGRLGGILDQATADSLFQLGDQIAQTADGAESLLNTGNGLYESIPNALPDGRTIQRDLQSYKPFAALEAEEANFADVLSQVRSQRRQLMGDLQTVLATVPTTEAEEQARQTKIMAIQSSLSALDSDTRDASDQMASRAEANENQRAKEEQAEQEAFRQLEREGIGQIPNPGQRN